MPLPNFLIIGAAKAGTTSLFYYLKQHPEIFMPEQKELNFFAFENEEIQLNGHGDIQDATVHSVTSLTEYKSRFSLADDSRFKAIGEASPVYLFSDKAAFSI